MKATYHGVFSLGVTALAVLFVLAVAWSLLTAGGAQDWLQDGRYVFLSAERYPAGSVTHFAFDRFRPPRPVGFFLVVSPDDAVTAVFDRVGGCQLRWRGEHRDLFDGCRGRAYAIEGVYAGESFAGDLVYLPVDRVGDRLRVDLLPVLPGR